MNPSKTNQRWAVVGGGFLGMTLALRLAQQGKDVTLYEAAPALGGLASAWQLGDVVWDRHYHVTLFSDTVLRSLLRELGLESEMRWTKTRTAFYTDSKLHSMSNVAEYLRFPLLGLIDKIRLGATILHASRIKDSKSLENIRVEDWLRKWSGDRVTDELWIPLLRSKLGDSYRDTSAAFIWSTVARMYAARRTSSKTELFGYVPGGYARVIERLAEVLDQAGLNCRIGKPVTEITGTTDGGVQIETHGERGEVFDEVVVTAAAPLAVRMCPQLTTVEKSKLNALRYQGIICASVLLKNSLSDFYITNIADGDMPYTAVIEMSAIVNKDQFGGRALVYLPKYVASDSKDFELSDDQIRERFLSALEKMHPEFHREDVLCFQISRVKYLLPIPTLNYSANLPQTTTSIRGLHIVNSAHIVNGTLNINETVQLAESAAKRLLSNFAVSDPSPKLVEHEFAQAHS